MSTSDDVVTQTTGTTKLYIGRVKWFNNKAGYGFITVTDGSRAGTDVFVHHSAINVDSEQYKYLVQGEYVEFDLSNTPTGNHEFQAAGVCGIKGGKLMCETRREFKLARTVYKNVNKAEELQTPPENVTSEPVSRQRLPPKNSYAAKARGEGPREGEKKEWTLVKGRAAAPNTSGRGRGRPPRTPQVAAEPK